MQEAGHKEQAKMHRLLEQSADFTKLCQDVMDSRSEIRRGKHEYENAKKGEQEVQVIHSEKKKTVISHLLPTKTHFFTLFYHEKDPQWCFVSFW